MIARFQALLPYTMHRPRGADPIVWNTTVDGYEVRIFPPQQACVAPEDLSGSSPVPLVEAMRGVRPNPAPSTINHFEMHGGPVIPVNLLVIDFLKDDFDRTSGSNDPPVELAFEIANDVLSRLRFLLRAPSVRPLLRDRTPARIDYLNDDGSEPAPAPPLRRSVVFGAFSMGVVGLDNPGWQEAAALSSDFEQPVWDSLLLDAFDLLPRIEASVVLASAALEAFIDWALDEFVTGGALDRTLYRWIADRDDMAKRPSTREQFDILLKSLGGATLTEDARLWGLFSELVHVRNKSVHEAKATLGGKPISVEKAYQLVSGAREIIDWVEKLLPEVKRRPVLSAAPVVTMLKHVTRAAAERGDAGPTDDETPSGDE